MTAWDAETAAACGIDWLLEATRPAGAFGRAVRAGRRLLAPGDEAEAVRRAAASVAFARRAGAAVLDALRSAVAAAPDLVPAARRAALGERLDDADLFEAQRLRESLAAIERLGASRDLALDAALRPAALTHGAALAPGATRDGRAFYLADTFSPELASARARAERAHARAELERSRVERDVAAALDRETLPRGEFVVMRDALPERMPAGLRVIRESATYLLGELALDEPALAALAAAETAAEAAAEQERAIRTILSEAIARDAEAVAAATEALGALDVAVAEALFALRYDACVPEVPAVPVLEVEAARFLPIAVVAEAYQPINLALEGASVVTGANMGGKSSALRTAAFVAACVVLGLPVPARRARVALFERIERLAPSDRESGAGLSAFGGEIVRAHALLNGSASRALVVIDEFARTTTPREGRALLVALIEALRARGAVVLAATHARGIAAAAGATALTVAGLRGRPTPGTGRSLESALEELRRLTDYRIVRVDAASDAPSDALELARALGLPESVVARAEALTRDDAE